MNKHLFTAIALLAVIGIANAQNHYPPPPPPHVQGTQMVCEDRRVDNGPNVGAAIVGGMLGYGMGSVYDSRGGHRAPPPRRGYRNGYSPRRGSTGRILGGLGGAYLGSQYNRGNDYERVCYYVDAYGNRRPVVEPRRY